MTVLKMFLISLNSLIYSDNSTKKCTYSPQNCGHLIDYIV